MSEMENLINKYFRPGLAQVGPMMNFGSFTNPAKLVMIFDMLAGRLEIFPMLVLFLPDTWRRF